MGDLKVIVVVVAGIDALVALVVGDGIEHVAVGDAVVVAVGDLAVEPEIGLFRLAKLFETAEEIHVDHVRRVKAQTVDAELVDPVFHCAEQVSHDVLVAEVELDQIVVTCPALVPEGIAVGTAAVEMQVLEPAAVGRIPLFLLHVLEGEEIPADMVENAVQDHADTVFAKGVADLLEGGVVA